MASPAPSPRGQRSRRLADRLQGAVAALTVTGLLFGLNAASAEPRAGTEDVVHWPGFRSDDHPALPTGAGPSADSVAVGTGPAWNALNWGPGPLAAVPAAYGFDTVVDGRTEQTIMVSSQANQDVGAADPIMNLSVSKDSGTTFFETQRHAPTSAINMVRLDDGSLLSIGFIPEWTDESHRTVELQLARSTNGGRTWRHSTGRYTPPDGKVLGPMNRGLRVHRSPKVLPDGTLVVPAYTSYQGERPSSIFLQSVDQGRTWTQRSQILADDIGLNEIGWSFDVNGDVVAAIRTTDSPAKLRTARSTDQGRTWSAPVPLLGPDGEQSVGIYPDLVLQPNGVLLMSTGRPDNRVFVSNDGTGRRWDSEHVVFANPPSLTGNGRYDGSSGNTSLVNVGVNRTLMLGDKCAVWGCQGYHEQFGVFVSPIQAVTPGTGLIDVATQLRTRTAKLTGDLSHRNRAFSETRPAGAFDGSTRPHAAAVLHHDGRPATMTLELDRVHTLGAIGLMLGSGQPLDATVSLSVDGTTWSDPVVEATQTTDFALRHTDFTPQQARYVRVTAPAGQLTPITELALYDAELQTFENDPLYEVPRGFTDAVNVTTTDQRLGGHYTDPAKDAGHHSSASMRLFDKDTADHARATKITEQRVTQRTAFTWSYGDFRGPFEFDIVGRDGDRATTPWRFRLNPGTSATAPPTLTAFDGSQWQPIGTLSAPITLDTWVGFEVTSTTDQATVSVAGEDFRTTVRAEETGTLGGVRFTTGDDSAYGSTFHLDDLAVTAA
ncbi:exo-alpha-sialidase [Propionibacteriaceae bacterium Y1685]|uniref:exo-alpha-sialidase n=1 Tax=Microlunatus sp. Y1700 TaxID=3418487 RepID=UPI003B7874CC